VFRTRENPITCRGLTFKQRLSYFASLFNYFSGLQRFALLGVLVLTLATGALPFHASPLALVALWLPWSVVAFIATLQLGRGSLGTMDSSRYGLLTMGINIRGIIAIVRRSTGAFKVTPKEGVDEGGLRVLRMLGLLTTVGVVLAVWLARVLTVAGVVDLPSMPEFATAVVIALGVWEMVCIGTAVVPLVRRRQLRTRYRAPVLMRGRIVGTTVRVSIVDVSPEGIGFECEVPYEPGDRIAIVATIPDAHGGRHDVTLPLDVRSCVASEEVYGYRIGCQVNAPDLVTHQRLVEFCDVVVPMERMGRRVVAPVRETAASATA